MKMQGIAKQFDELIGSFNTQGSNLVNRIAEIEVNAQINSLRELVIEILRSVVNNIIIMELIRGQCQQPKVFYNTPSHVLVTMVIDDVHDDFSTEQAVALYFNDINDIMEAQDHLRDREDWGKEETKKNIAMVNQATDVATKEIVPELFPMMAFNLQQKKSQDNMLCKMNSEQSIWNAKKEQNLPTKKIQ